MYCDYITVSDIPTEWVRILSMYWGMDWYANGALCNCQIYITDIKQAQEFRISVIPVTYCETSINRHFISKFPQFYSTNPAETDPYVKAVSIIMVTSDILVLVTDDTLDVCASDALHDGIDHWDKTNILKGEELLQLHFDIFNSLLWVFKVLVMK